jgi:hypothetical protein
MSGTQKVHWADTQQVDEFVKEHGKHPAIDNFMVTGEDTTDTQKALLKRLFKSREAFPNSHMTNGSSSHNHTSQFFTEFEIVWPKLTGKKAMEAILSATASQMVLLLVSRMLYAQDYLLPSKWEEAGIEE